MIARPPASHATAVLLDVDFADGDGLLITSPGPGSATGQPFGERTIADATLDAEIGLLEGEPEDRYGLFFRQTAPERYMACTISAAGHLSLGVVDAGPPLVVAERQLDGEVHFRGGLGVTNRLTIVACGPVARRHGQRRRHCRRHARRAVCRRPGWRVARPHQRKRAGPVVGPLGAGSGDHLDLPHPPLVGQLVVR